MSNLIRKILVSEKSFADASAGKFTFIVDKKMSKIDAGKAVNDLFGIEIISLNSMNYKGKVKISRKNRGKRNDFKKIIVTTKPGSKIDLFEVEKAEETKKNAASAKSGAGAPASEGMRGKAVKKIEENKNVEVTVKTK
jgi:large subunit ribosomal protein L23